MDQAPSPAMRTPAALLVSLVVAVGLAAPLAAEDRIYLTDGSSIDCSILEESIKVVSFKVGGKTKTAASDSVLKIEYERKPRLVDEADTTAADGGVLDAVDLLNQYIDGYLGGNKPRRGQEWGPAYAMGRVVELLRSIGDSEGVIEAAERLIKNAPDSRQVPFAYLAKANAQMRLGKMDAAKATLVDFQGVINDQGLSELWRLECRLGLTRADSTLSASARQEQFKELAAEAGDDYPTAKNRARVYEGQSLLTGSSPDFEAAQRVFERVVEDPKADDETLAGAYVGLGDCIFQEAGTLVKKGEDASAELKQALLYYLRVVVVYADEVDYCPKALFFAGRCYDLMAETDEEAKERARTLFRSLMRDYPGSNWANEARAYA